MLDWQAAVQAGARSAGGKGWQLGLLASYGLPVPDGFVISAEIHREACGDTGSPSEIPLSLRHALEQALDVRGWLDIPLAVRSSAALEDSPDASFAGMHLTRLNVQGMDCLCRAIVEVWASLGTPQAQAYRKRLDIAEADAAMAVVVMPLLKAKASGVAFSCDPRSGRDDHLLINANWGLGESVVNGAVEADEYLFSEDPLDESLSLTSQHTGGKTWQTIRLDEGGTAMQATPPGMAAEAIFNPAQALELAQLVYDAALALDFTRPRYDVEWVWDGDKFWLVQARPITAMARRTYLALVDQPTFWSNGNARDVVPLPMSAQEWRSVRIMVGRVVEQYCRRAGYPVMAGLERARLFSGRVYVDMTLSQFEHWDAFGIGPADFNRQLGGHQPEIRVPSHVGWRKKLVWVWRWLQLGVRIPSLRRQADALALRIRQLADQMQAHQLSEDDGQAIEEMHHMRRVAFDQDDLCFLQMPGGSTSMVLELLDKQLGTESNGLAAVLLAEGENSVTAQQGRELVALAQLAATMPDVSRWLMAAERGDNWQHWPETHPFRQQFAEFLEEYGHRAVYESYSRHLRWRESPGYLLDCIAGLLHLDPDTQVARHAEARLTAWQSVRSVLPWWRQLQLRQLLRLANEENNQRELARSSFIRLLAAGRQQNLKMGQRLVTRGVLVCREDIFELTASEIERALSGKAAAAGIRARVQSRREQRLRWESQDAPDVIYEYGIAPECVAECVGSGSGQALTGTAISAGRARGIARVIHHPADAGALEQGDILVCPSTDPAWTLLFLRAGALVMETGGYLSHGAIVAREFGIPAVANLSGVLNLICDGQEVEVDGNSGMISLIAGDSHIQ